MYIEKPTTCGKPLSVLSAPISSSLFLGTGEDREMRNLLVPLSKGWNTSDALPGVPTVVLGLEHRAPSRVLSPVQERRLNKTL